MLKANNFLCGFLLTIYLVSCHSVFFALFWIMFLRKVREDEPLQIDHVRSVSCNSSYK